MSSKYIKEMQAIHDLEPSQDHTPLSSHVRRVKSTLSEVAITRPRIQRRKRSNTIIDHDLDGGFEHDPMVNGNKRLDRFQVYSVDSHRIVFTHKDVDVAIDYAKACSEGCRVIDNAKAKTVFRNWS